MPSKPIGELRRSAAIQTFGPGAVVDFRSKDAPISGVVCGLEEWDRNFPPPGLRNPQTIREERLQKKLNVKCFRLSPVRDPVSAQDKERALVAVRFPQWLQCPKCELIGPEDKWNSAPGDAARWCTACTLSSPGRKNVYAVPVRFVTACEHGHLDEFPWHIWVQHKEGCTNRHGFLQLTSEQAGLAGIILSCPKCQHRRSMDGIFSIRGGSSAIPTCRGRRPWLAAPPETCPVPKTVRVLQRGASNLYFPMLESALSIPPWSDRLQEAIGVLWEPLAASQPDKRAGYVRLLEAELKDVLHEFELTPEQLGEEIERRIHVHENIDTDNLRLEEYRQLSAGVPTAGIDREFEIRPRVVPADIKSTISRLVKVVRLREVRALKGFTRINPPGDPAGANVASVSLQKLDWLPAIEVRGEGIFLTLNEEMLSSWEERQPVKDRASAINLRYEQDWRARYGKSSSPPREISARFLLVHTFAHAVMRQLTLDCGYSSSALRERLYVDRGETPMAGLLIYTASSDDDGTLGGLQRQGDPERAGRIITAAIQAQKWCSSDPLCIQDVLAPRDGFSLAACHACVLAPETACEEFNWFLDRAMLVGTPTDCDIGFFRHLTTVETA